METPVRFLVRKLLATGLLLLVPVLLFAQMKLASPNNEINVSLVANPPIQGDIPLAKYAIQVDRNREGQKALLIIDLGLERSDQMFFDELTLVKVGKPVLVKEEYTALHGKRSVRNNLANEVKLEFENPNKSKLNVIVRAYNDGLAFRYEFPEKTGSFVMNDERTRYKVDEGTVRWLQPFHPANEGLYARSTDGANRRDWTYPALFNRPNTDAWFLIHEAGLDRTYCGTKLSNMDAPNGYKTAFPNPRDGNGIGEVKPIITLPWQSPWRVVLLGNLATIVESTLVDDVSAPTALTNTDWIKPGAASWNYWSNNHGTRDFNVVCEFADLAVTMGWPYTLLDWEWDTMGNGGMLEDALTYIHALGVKPLMWFNSGGPHTGVTSTPRDKMMTHESRVETFSWLKKLGVAGVKIDFFESEKQDMIAYYLDILEDAAVYEIMVYFHGCLVPRGWERTYPHLMTYEGVRGAEWYNNGPDFTTTAPEHNTVMPFTRNVVGAMDYTPVTFTNSQFPHITSFGHELALSVVFESGIQHFADRPDGYNNLPDAAKDFLRHVPVAWDDTKLVDGTLGRSVVMARRKADEWYIGGIYAERSARNRTISLGFLPDGQRYRLTLIADGDYDTQLKTRYQVVDASSALNVRVLGRGGFVARLTPVEP